MIICDTHNFTFLRIPKNASSSLAEYFVRNFCGPRDKYTEINDCGIKTQNVPETVIKKYKHKYRFIHLTLQELIDNNLITREDAFQKRNIGVIRNPLDRQLSLYFFLKRKKNPSPEEFRSQFQNGYHQEDPSNRILQTEYVSIDGNDVGDWWAYDDISKKLAEFTSEKGVGEKKNLQMYKSSFKPRKVDLMNSYYDQATIDAVKKYYEKDFEKYYEIAGSKYETV